MIEVNRDAIKELSSKTKYSASEVECALKFMVEKGFDTETSVGILEKLLVGVTNFRDLMEMLRIMCS